MKREIDRGNWTAISDQKPEDGQEVLLFLRDGRIIRTKWSKVADDLALATGLSYDKCYPLFWCDAAPFEATIQDKDILIEAISKFGEEKQIDMAIEECSELINALEKFRRGRVERFDVITEIADVQIMCEQMAIIFGEGGVFIEKQRKLERLKERLNKQSK